MAVDVQLPDRVESRGPVGLRLEHLAWASVVLAVLPIAVALVRALSSGWMPLGDNAYFTVRSRDVLTSNHPLLGAWSSGSGAVGESLNNLGPLQLDLLAPFTKVAPLGGTAVGVGLLNAAAIVVIAWLVHKVAGPLAVILAMVCSSLLAWSMGSALLLGPRQHRAMILPFLCFLTLCWVLANGRDKVLPLAVFVGSLLVQTHVTYLLLVPVLMLWALVRLLMRPTSGSGEPVDPGERPSRWATLRRPFVLALVVGGVCWSQPLVDQVAGTGNLGRMLTTSGEGTGPGIGVGLRLAASVVAAPPSWARAGFRGRDDLTLAPVGPAAALALLGVAATVGVLTWLLSRRRGDRPAMLALEMSAVATVIGIVTAARIPVGAFGLLASNYRWLWPIAMFGLFAVALGLLDPRPQAGGGGTRRMVVASSGTLTVLALALANLPAGDELWTEYPEVPIEDVAQQLFDQLDEADLSGPLLIDRTRTTLAEPYSYLVMVALQEQGISFTFDDAKDISRFGTDRRDDGAARQSLLIVSGPSALADLPGARRVALGDGLGEARAEMELLRRTMVDQLVSGSLALNETGRRELEAGRLPTLEAARRGVEVDDVDLDRDLAYLQIAGGLAPGPDQEADLARLGQLASRDRMYTVGLFLAPV